MRNYDIHLLHDAAMTEQIHELIYTSTATPGIDIQPVLHEARLRNEQNEVTGLMVFDGTNFMQLLEGPKHSAAYVFGLIALSPWHSRIRVHSRATALARSFGKWPMKYCDQLVGEIDLASSTNNETARMLARITLMRCFHDNSN